MGLFDIFGSTPSPPTPVNPYQVINAQQTASQNAANNSAFLNNVNQRTPYGNLTYNLLDGVIDYGGNWVPRFEAVTSFTPEQQKLYDTQMKVTQGAYDLAGKYTDRIADATSQPFSLNGAPAAPTTPQYNDAFHDEVYGKILARNQPQQDRDRAAMETKLANQGISLGTDAWKASQDDFSRGVNDFRLAADIDAGNQAINRFNANAASYGMGTDARKNWVTEQQMLRMQPIQETAALMGTGGGQQYPTFVPTNNYQVQPADATGAFGMAAAQQQKNYQSQVEAQSAATSGFLKAIGSLGGAAIMASDERVKENISHVGKTNDGQNIYSYNYKGDSTPQMGLIAQEVAKKHPEAVAQRSDGLLGVLYDFALESSRRPR